MSCIQGINWALRLYYKWFPVNLWLKSKIWKIWRKYEDQGFTVTGHDQKKEIQKVFSIHVHVRKLLFTKEKEKLF